MNDYVTYRLAALIVIAFVYMVFDVFNKRNVPSVFAYATLILGIAFTLLYLDLFTILESFGVALVVGGLGYAFYKAGQIGAADIFEMCSISLILPLQQVPQLINVNQFGIPFIVGVFIATGVVALALIPFYYLPRAERMFKKKLMQNITKLDVYKGTILCASYTAFAIFLVFELGINLLGISLLVVIMISSFITSVFERPITDSMVKYISPKDFEEGDIIAVNLMKESEYNKIKRKIDDFDRLVTPKIMKAMNKLKIKTKFPVYREAMPLALPIFLGVVISILYGNVILAAL